MPQGLRANADAYGAPLMRRLDELAAFTEVPGQLTRRYLSRAHLAASRQVAAWMQEAGMGVRTDALFSVFGRYEGRRPQAPAIMLGSHLDTVLDAGRYDGALGVLAAIAVVAELSRCGERLQHAIEVAAFGEAEGSRFSAHLLTSSALIGAVGPELMDSRDKDGISVREAVAAAGGNADDNLGCARKAGEIAACLELHIEQGPVLEQSGLALGAVTAINGSHRLSVTVSGFAGHAGTVPMSQRRDALAAAAKWFWRSSPWPAATKRWWRPWDRSRPCQARKTSRARSGSASTCAVSPLPSALRPIGPCAPRLAKSPLGAALSWRLRPTRRMRPHPSPTPSSPRFWRRLQLAARRR
jgi:allantoate deiminase